MKSFQALCVCLVGGVVYALACWGLGELLFDDGWTPDGVSVAIAFGWGAWMGWREGSGENE